MTPKEHYKLVKLSLKYDLLSWNSDKLLMNNKAFKLYNDDLNCSIWVANGLISIEINILNDSSSLYKINMFQKIYLYYYYRKWLKIYRKTQSNKIDISVNAEYQKFLNRNKTLYKVLNE